MQHASFILVLDYKLFEYWNNLSINFSTVLDIITLNILKANAWAWAVSFRSLWMLKFIQLKLLITKLDISFVYESL